ncbi:MAG: hypothetical protein IPP11_11780 [Chitinophagaceae bacterium]|nr:hypothetical protein [Chitinophagaceae bacterium]
MNRIEELGAWDFEDNVSRVLGNLNLHHLNEKPVSTLSWRTKKELRLPKR